MGRSNRQISSTDRYHIILRGVNRQDIFLDDYDRKRFIGTMRKYSAELNADIIAFCLMNNHVHILAHIPDPPDLLMKKISSSYVYYFNHRYDRVGHLFQERFRSEPVQSDSYLLTAARYILQNPQKAGICRMQDYLWSSWNYLKERSDFCDPEVLIRIAEGYDRLMEYLVMENEDTCLEAEDRHILTDDEALLKIRKAAGISNPFELLVLPRAQRNDLLRLLKNEEIPVRQLARLTGLDRNIIQRA